MDHILFDFSRIARIGLPEAVFCEGKPIGSIIELMSHFRRDNDHPMLFTRLAEEVFNSLPERLRESCDYHPLSKTAFQGIYRKKSGTVSIVSAGTADCSVGWEAARTLQYLGFSYRMFEDCGVAGLWRLTDRLEQINQSDVVIVVAGLDAALASILGGLTSKPLFAVPTSIGYGLAEKGRTALSSMLCSCAPGVSVFNIDNGYGAACAAARVLNLLYKNNE